MSRKTLPKILDSTCQCDTLEVKGARVGEHPPVLDNIWRHAMAKSHTHLTLGRDTTVLRYK